jgi:diphthamide biosynthesis methyltransferase
MHVSDLQHSDHVYSKLYKYILCSAQEKLERELEKERQANRAREEEQEKRRNELEELKKVSVSIVC